MRKQAWASTNNRQRMIEIISRRALASSGPKFHPGDRVRWRGAVGVIDCAFFDLRAAIDAFAVPKEWYGMQEQRPKTPEHGRWYAVILDEGAVLAGELDLEEMVS